MPVIDRPVMGLRSEVVTAHEATNSGLKGYSALMVVFPGVAVDVIFPVVELIVATLVSEDV